MKFLKTLKLQILIQGNFTEQQALDVNSIALKNLQLSDDKSQRRMKENSAFEIPTGATYLKVKSFLSNDKNSIIKNYYQIGKNSIESECLLELLVKIVREPLFNSLRTQQQLGYSVSCASKNDNDILGFTITVESQEKRNSARHVDAKIENFLTDFLTTLLNDTSDSEFETMKRSIINQKRSNDIDLESEVVRNWHEIRDKKNQFERNEIEARQMELLNKNSLIIFFKEYLLPSSQRRKLSLQVLANAGDDVSLLEHGFVHLDLIKNDDSQNCVGNLLRFRESLKIFSLANH